MSTYAPTRPAPEHPASQAGRRDPVHAGAAPESAGAEICPRAPLAPFVVGTVIGGLAGAILGTALSPHTRGFLVGLVHLISRRLSSAERDQLRFELLLQ